MTTLQNKNYKAVPESLNIIKQYKGQSWWKVLLISLAIFFIGEFTLGTIFSLAFSAIFPEDWEIIVTLFSFLGILLATIIVNKYLQ